MTVGGQVHLTHPQRGQSSAHHPHLLLHSLAIGSAAAHAAGQLECVRHRRPRLDAHGILRVLTLRVRRPPLEAVELLLQQRHLAHMRRVQVGLLLGQVRHLPLVLAHLP